VRASGALRVLDERSGAEMDSVSDAAGVVERVVEQMRIDPPDADRLTRDIMDHLRRCGLIGHGPLLDSSHRYDQS
jgi:hypothetical protein